MASPIPPELLPGCLEETGGWPVSARSVKIFIGSDLGKKDRRDAETESEGGQTAQTDRLLGGSVTEVTGNNYRTRTSEDRAVCLSLLGSFLQNTQTLRSSRQRLVPGPSRLKS